MARPEPREYIGPGACPACGARVALKVSINGRVYLRCGAIRDATGRECGHRVTYGPDDSDAMIARLRATAHAEPTAPPAPAALAPAAEPKPAKGKGDGTGQQHGEQPRRAGPAWGFGNL